MVDCSARQRFPCAGLLVSCVVAFAAGSTPCRSGDWQYERELRFDHPTARPNSVVGITLSARSRGIPYMNPDGSDVRFTECDRTTPLNYWIELWNPAGESRVWVKVPKAKTAAIVMKYGNPAAAPASAGSGVFDFFDDFNNGIWTKYPLNPVMTRTRAWEARVICEPSVLYEGGTFNMWYMGCATSGGNDAALGYAASTDGLNWTKAANNPVLQEPNEAVIRTTVVKHRGVYYLFATDYQWNSAPGNLRRWTSTDGLNWTHKTIVLRPTQPWEDKIQNVGVTIDENGTWHMLYTTNGPMGYARSTDGLTWIKHPDPVLSGFYGGDPYLTKIRGTFYTWHSQAHQGHLLIYCRKSNDMIHWKMVGTGPQLGYTQPWERGIGRSEVSWNRHLSDAELLEHGGRVWMYYQGAQCPLGVARFNGTWTQLADRLENNPPLRQWAFSHFGCVEDNQLKLSDDQTGDHPLHEDVAQFSDREGYIVACQTRAYFGYRDEPAQTVPNGWSTPTRSVAAGHPQISVVMRYRNDGAMARFRLVDKETTCYEERCEGRWSKPVNIGPNHACNGQWHRWRIEVEGSINRLYLDDVFIGSHASGATLCDRSDLRVGFATHGGFVAFDDVRVTRLGLVQVLPPLSFPSKEE